MIEVKLGCVYCVIGELLFVIILKFLGICLFVLKRLFNKFVVNLFLVIYVVVVLVLIMCWVNVKFLV